jgi:hypothetical protein
MNHVPQRINFRYPARWTRTWIGLLGLAGLSLLAADPPPQAYPLLFAKTNALAEARATLTDTLQLPGHNNVYLFAPQSRNWTQGNAIQGVLIWPTNAPRQTQMLAFMKDRDGNWFQSLRSDPLASGTNRWSFDISPEATDWRPVGHHMVWNHRIRLDPLFVGIRLFSIREAYTGNCHHVSATLTVTNGPAGPPAIRNVRPSSRSIPCFGLFELRFELSDRYSNPFDPAAIDVSASIETPDGTTNHVNAFYMQDYYRVLDDVGESLIPQGRPEWRVRYAPRVPGLHRYTLTATDPQGTTRTETATFEAREAKAPRFVRVAAKDPRFFELDDGAPFFPIGHNTRSPFDTRMDEQFPWRFRHPEGTSAYRRYFQSMSAAGENLAEIWMCQWSLGLEWSTVSPGYHGAGDYHLGNAWELDEVLRWARESRLRINLVLNNHGRVGLGYDAEWGDHPFNIARGGFIAADDPMHFFDNPKAIALQRQLFRYIVARWGWDASIFAWELWSELDLVGKQGQAPVPQKDPRVVEWHRQMGTYIRSIDPNRHLITTHLSGDYHITSPELAQLPQLDHCGIDAYHSSDNPLQIVNLVRETAEHYRAFNKPVLITEFGGSSMGAGVGHLKRELHAALWSSVCAPLAGTPLFWWWQVIEEQNLYPMYTSVSRFMADVDRRDPAFLPVRMQLAFDEKTPIPEEEADHIAMATTTQALGWVFIRPCFLRNGEPLEKPLDNMTLTWTGCSNTVYRTAYYDTLTGTMIKQQDARAENNRLTVHLPPITRDVAFKIRMAAGLLKDE